jgi:hypothetical protein
MTELITRLPALAERAVDKALIYDCSDPEDRYIYRELQELRELVQQRADGPTDEKILMTYQYAVSSKVESIVQSTGGYQGTLREHAAVTLAGLHAVLARWGCSAIEPVPEGPTDMDIEDLMRQHTSNLGDNLIGVATQDVPALIRAALSHWGRPAIEPVPLSEGPPKAKDCDAEGRCYIWDWLSCEWRAIEALNKPLDGWGTTWWLPFHALPAPASQEVS